MLISIFLWRELDLATYFRRSINTRSVVWLHTGQCSMAVQYWTLEEPYMDILYYKLYCSIIVSLRRLYWGVRWVYYWRHFIITILYVVTECYINKPWNQIYDNILCTCRQEYWSRSWIFYIHSSVHRDSVLIRSNKMQQHAGIYLLQNKLYMFRVYIAPIIRST